MLPKIIAVVVPEEESERGVLRPTPCKVIARFPDGTIRDYEATVTPRYWEVKAEAS